MSRQKILEIKNLCFSYKKNTSSSHTIYDFSLTIFEGETVAIIGESGCGKSTLAKTILGITTPTSGNIFYKNIMFNKYRRADSFFIKRDIQMVFQDPYSSLNPRMNIEDIIAEPLIIHKIGTYEERNNIINELLTSVELPKSYKKRYPHELSGGERQRVSIARALSCKPKLLICDEPTHALDVSIQASIINLLKELRIKFNLSLLFISHDLCVVKNISDKTAVMYGGQIVEEGDTKDVFNNPRHPYTKKLINAAILNETKCSINFSDKKDSENIIPKIDDPVLKLQVLKLQNSINKTYGKSLLPLMDNKKSDLRKCPYLGECKEREDACNVTPISATKTKNTHKILCHKFIDQKK